MYEKHYWHSSSTLATVKMKLRLFSVLLSVLLAVDQNYSSPAGRTEQAVFEQYLTRARAVLDRVPLIDG